MKKLNVLLVALFLSTIVFSQNIEKQTVVGIAEEFHELEWYEQQKVLWRKEIDKDPKNEDAWMNYYQASRAILHKNGGNPHGKASPAMEVVNEMEKHIPNTFTFNFCKGNQLGKDEGYEKYNIKAYEINPDDSRVYDNLVVYYEMIGDNQKRIEINKKWNSKNIYSPGLLNFGHNVLTSVEENAVVLTVGDNDTYPLWMLQDAFGFRKDVIVANASMIKDEKYRKLIFSRMGVSLTKEEDKKLQIAPNHSQEEFESFVRSFVQIVHKKGVPMYVSSTSKAQNDEKLKANFYNIGIVSKYAEEPIDKIAYLKRNVMNRYLWDYVKHDFYNESIPVLVSFANDNYVPGLLVLRDHFRASENNEGVRFCEELLLAIAKNSRMKDLIIKYVNQ